MRTAKPKPYILHPKPCTLHPKPAKPKPYILHPNTLHPTPYTPNVRVAQLQTFHSNPNLSLQPKGYPKQGHHLASSKVTTTTYNVLSES